MAQQHTWKSGLALVFTLLIFSSCQGGDMSLKKAKGVTTSPSIGKPGIGLKSKIAVIDFLEHSQEKIPGTPNICPVTGLHFIPGSVIPGSGARVAEQIRFALLEKDFDVFHNDSVLEALKNIPEANREHYTGALGVNIGKALGADFVIMGSVMRLEERVGGKLAVEKPAAVGFSLALISLPGGQISWKAKFEKRQTSFLGNVLDYQTFFKGGMVWLKASELSKIGVENTLARLLPVNAEK